MQCCHTDLNSLEECKSVVFLHGFMQDHTTFSEMCDLVREKGLVPYAFHYEPLLSTEATLEGLSCWLEKEIEGSGVRKPFLLVGYSQGGRIALTYAQRNPSLVHALLLESAGFGPTTADERAILTKRAEQWTQKFGDLDAYSHDELVDWWESLSIFKTQKNLPLAIRQRIREMRCAQNRLSLMLQVQHAGAHMMPFASETIRSLDQLPLRVVYAYGRQDEKYCKLAQYIQAESHRIQVEVFESGHMIHEEQKEEFMRLVVRLAQR